MAGETQPDYKSMIHTNSDPDELSYFNPYRLGNPYSDMMVKGIPMVFVTTPMLNLSDQNINASSFFKYMSTNNSGLFSLLNYNGFGSGEQTGQIGSYTTSPFIKLLSNRFVNIDIGDTTAQSKQYGETFYGYKMEVPGPIVESINGGQFSITFQETRDGAIMKIMKTWVEYMENLARGTMYTSEEAKTQKILDYTCSVYYFLLDFDGQTIQYYTKYTGCTPTNIPYSNFSQEVAGGHDAVTMSISFNFSFKEDMDPQILSDFNLLNSSAPELISGGTEDKYSIYQSASKMVGSTDYSYVNWAENKKLTQFRKAGVFLENYGDNSSKYRYKLKFQ